MTEEALASSFTVETVLVDEDRIGEFTLPDGVAVCAMPAHVLAAVCDTKTPQGIAAILRMQSAAPIFTRIGFHTMETGRTMTLPFMQHAQATAAQTGLSFTDDALWLEADRSFAWPDPVPSEQYWKELAKA